MALSLTTGNNNKNNQEKKQIRTNSAEHATIIDLHQTWYGLCILKWPIRVNAMRGTVLERLYSQRAKHRGEKSAG